MCFSQYFKIIYSAFIHYGGVTITVVPFYERSHYCKKCEYRWSILLLFFFRYYRPGPRFRPLPDMKYIVYGFAYIQDMIEHAIIKEQTGLEEEIGIVGQQFPYPCYVEDRYGLCMKIVSKYEFVFIIKFIICHNLTFNMQNRLQFLW